MEMRIFTNVGLKLVKMTISFHSRVRIQGKTPFFSQNLQISWKTVDFGKTHGFQWFCGFPGRNLWIFTKIRSFP